MYLCCCIGGNLEATGAATVASVGVAVGLGQLVKRANTIAPRFAGLIRMVCCVRAQYHKYDRSIDWLVGWSMWFSLCRSLQWHLPIR
jgi:hypothetical protein